jgi:hypothetical protein
MKYRNIYCYASNWNRIVENISCWELPNSWKLYLTSYRNKRVYLYFIGSVKFAKMLTNSRIQASSLTSTVFNYVEKVSKFFALFWSDPYGEHQENNYFYLKYHTLWYLNDGLKFFSSHSMKLKEYFHNIDNYFSNWTHLNIWFNISLLILNVFIFICSHISEIFHCLHIINLIFFSISSSAQSHFTLNNNTML